MKIKYYLLFFYLIFHSALIYSQTINSISVLSFNIRYDNPNDGSNNWESRKEGVVSLIEKINPDLIGIQEALYNQIVFLDENLKDLNYTGVGRDDGIKEGEFSAVFYNKNKFDLLESNTFWLSDNPGKPGIAWGACCNRIVTWAKFKIKSKEDIFYHFNTHFDHQSKNARVNSSKLLAGKISEIASDLPVVITGDFNCTSNSEEFQLLIESLSLINTRDLFEDNLSQNHDFTFNGFGNFHDKIVIDHIIINNKFSADSYKIIYDKFNNKYISDHYPVLAKITFINK